jgi:uncharacterized repeat protein (TIGR03803 family)
MDSRGNLYGTTEQGGTLGDGTVFELSPPSTSGALSRFALAGNPEAWIARIRDKFVATLSLAPARYVEQ